MKENEEEIQENSVVVNGEVAYEHYKHVVEDNQVTMRIDKFVSNQIANMTCGMIELRFTFKPMQLILQSMLKLSKIWEMISLLLVQSEKGCTFFHQKGKPFFIKKKAMAF